MEEFMKTKKQKPKFREHVLSKKCWCNPKVISYKDTPLHFDKRGEK